MSLHTTFIPHPGTARGATLLEVLITIVILAFGLLGLVGLEAKMQTSEVESYQRALRVDRRPEIYIDLGLAQLDLLDRRAAIESFATAGSFAPVQLERIPYPDVRAEAERRIRAIYGEEWLPTSR